MTPVFCLSSTLTCLSLQSNCSPAQEIFSTPQAGLWQFYKRNQSPSPADNNEEEDEEEEEEGMTTSEDTAQAKEPRRPRLGLR